MSSAATNLVRDAFYTSVGFGLITFQRAQVRRREITAEVEQQIEELRKQAAAVGDLLQSGATDARDQVRTITGR